MTRERIAGSLCGAVALLMAGQGAAQDVPSVERQVAGATLVSEANPAVTITVPEDARYLGAERILINGRFDAELHVFAEADAYGEIERFYWFQFESYLPDAEGSYDYRTTIPDVVGIDGFEMYMTPGGANTEGETITPGSDYAAFRGLVEEAGLRLPTWLSTLRLVHLPHSDDRTEFIVFYGEGPDGLAAAAAEAMLAGEPGLMFDDMLVQFVDDVDALVTLEATGE